MGKTLDTFCIYIHTNKVNGKRYIGQTCKYPPECRWGKNGKGYSSNKHFTNAILKYGWNSFSHSIVISGLTLEEANLAESLLIEAFDTMNPEHGYNKKDGGNNGHLSEEARKNISQANKGKAKPPGFGKKISLAKKGHIVEANTRIILSKKCSGWHHTEEGRHKISEKNTGKHWYNNGERNVFDFECPDGFVPGMMPYAISSSEKKSAYFKQTKWFTDGVKNVRAIECPVGFYAGRTKRKEGV